MLNQILITLLFTCFVLPVHLTAQTTIKFMDGWITMTVPGSWQPEPIETKTDENGSKRYNQDYQSATNRYGNFSLSYMDQGNTDITSASELKMLYDWGRGENFEVISSEVITINGREWMYGITKLTSASVPAYIHEFHIDTEKGFFQITFSLFTDDPSGADYMAKAMKQTLKVSVR